MSTPKTTKTPKTTVEKKPDTAKTPVKKTPKSKVKNIGFFDPFSGQVYR